MVGGRGTSIRIFLVDGTAEGIRLLEKSNWTGRALVTYRADYPRARSREELSGPGVYVLSGPSDEGPRLSVYVGEGDDVGKRLDAHARTLDFWTAPYRRRDANLAPGPRDLGAGADRGSRSESTPPRRLERGVRV